MKPILYEATETAFTTLGIGVLADAISCYVTEERNGAYELEMVYPASGQYADEIQRRRFILAKPNQADNPQPFRIYKIKKSLNGYTITVNAEHISYDLSGYALQPYVAADIQSALAGLTTHCVTNNNPFVFQTSRSTVATFQPSEPGSTRSWLGGRQGSLLDVYGGEWHFTGYNARLETARGSNRGVRIMYGKNLIDLDQEEECSNLYSHVYPFYKGQDGTVVTGNLTQVAAVSYTRVLVLDLTEQYADAETPPTSGELTADAVSYIAKNNLSVPKVNLQLDYAELASLNEPIDLCDTVTVYFELFGVSAAAKCIRTTWDTLLDRYDSIELGDAKDTLADTIVGQQQSIDEVSTTVTQDRQDLQVNITNVYDETQTALQTNSDAITALAARTTTIENSYVDENGVEQILSTHDYVNQTQLTQTADGITATVSQLSTTVDAQGATLNELSTAVTVDINGVSISKSNSDIKGVFGNSSLDFVNGNGDKLAWISAQDDGLGAAQLSLGDPTLATNRWRIYATSDGTHLRMTRHV